MIKNRMKRRCRFCRPSQSKKMVVNIEDIKIVNMELQPGHNLSMCMFFDVTNAAELRAAILRQSFEAAFINAQMVMFFNFFGV